MSTGNAHEPWIPPPAGYCRQRRADDPHLRDTDLHAEITSLGFRGRPAAMIHYLRNRRPARQPCTQCASPADRAIAAKRHRGLLAPAGPLPVPVRPLAGEMLASYLRRLATANHLPVPALMSALPAWLTWKFAIHRLLPRGTGPPPGAAASLHRLAELTATPAASIARALPIFGGGPQGPARATTACPRCAATRGITQPVPVHQAASEAVCTRHGIWLPPPGLPQLDVSACPEISVAQHHARRLLHRWTPEQLIYAQVEAAAEPSTGWEQRAHLLRKANPGLSTSAEAELTRAARYPDLIALSPKILTAAARDPASSGHILPETIAGRVNWQERSRNVLRAGLTGKQNTIRSPINQARAGQKGWTGPTYLSPDSHDNFHLATQTVTTIAAKSASSRVGPEQAAWVTTTVASQ